MIAVMIVILMMCTKAEVPNIIQGVGNVVIGGGGNLVIGNDNVVRAADFTNDPEFA